VEDNVQIYSLGPIIAVYLRYVLRASVIATSFPHHPVTGCIWQTFVNDKLQTVLPSKSATNTDTNLSLVLSFIKLNPFALKKYTNL